jgi:hypothetical protein
MGQSRLVSTRGVAKDQAAYANVEFYVVRGGCYRPIADLKQAELIVQKRTVNVQRSEFGIDPKATPAVLISLALNRHAQP